MYAKVAAQEKKSNMEYQKEPPFTDHMLYYFRWMCEILQIYRSTVSWFKANVDAKIKDRKEQPKLPIMRDSVLESELEKESDERLNAELIYFSKQDFAGFFRAG